MMRWCDKRNTNTQLLQVVAFNELKWWARNKLSQKFSFFFLCCPPSAHCARTAHTHTQPFNQWKCEFYGAINEPENLLSYWWFQIKSKHDTTNTKSKTCCTANGCCFFVVACVFMMKPKIPNPFYFEINKGKTVLKQSAPK